MMAKRSSELTGRWERDLSAIVSGEEIPVQRGERIGLNFQYTYSPEAVPYGPVQEIDFRAKPPGRKERPTRRICCRFSFAPWRLCA